VLLHRAVGGGISPLTAFFFREKLCERKNVL